MSKQMVSDRMRVTRSRGEEKGLWSTDQTGRIIQAKEDETRSLTNVLTWSDGLEMHATIGVTRKEDQ
jgi:hypothetical protein